MLFSKLCFAFCIPIMFFFLLFFQCFIIMYLYSISLEYLYSNSFQNGIPSSGCGAPQYGGSISVLFFSCCPGTTTSIHSVCGDPCEVEQSVLVMSYEALPTLTSWIKWDDERVTSGRGVAGWNFFRVGLGAGLIAISPWYSPGINTRGREQSCAEAELYKLIDWLTCQGGK